MYLRDADIRALLPELDIEANHPDHPFDADEQIQPCTIDLRLGSLFWKPKRQRALDFRKSGLLEIQPRRYYKRIALKQGESITIKPGRLLLGRIYEVLTIPPGYAAQVLGRSSFARLGLMVHCSAGYINPGYRGHMTLQLFNMNPNPIKLYPYLPICQLKIVKLTGTPERLYGEQELQSKYVDDDGGPSYWWRDKRISRLQETLGTVHVGAIVQQEILERVGNQEPEILERLERKVSRMRVHEIENSQAVLESFAEDEDRRRSRRKIMLATARVGIPVFVAVSLFLLARSPYATWYYVVWTLAGLLSLVCIFSFSKDVGEHFGKKELNRVDTRNDGAI